MKIYFEDKMQDFLMWEIDKEGVIINSEPFQKSIWAGEKLILNSIQKGKKPIFENGRTLNYKIIKIEK
jgi:hypothetical protein